MRNESLVFALLGWLLFTPLAHAIVVVGPDAPVYAEFDVSALPNGNVTQFGVICPPSICDDPSLGNPDPFFDADAMAEFRIGTTPGGDDLLNFIHENPLDQASHSFGVGISPANDFIIPTGVSSIYMMIVFINDRFNVDQLSLFIDGMLITAPATSVPAPGALLLFLTGLFGLRAAKSRKSVSSL